MGAIAERFRGARLMRHLCGLCGESDVCARTRHVAISLVLALTPACSTDATRPSPSEQPPTAQLRSALSECGDGLWEEPEECDTGGETEACSSECAVQSMPASVQGGAAWRAFGSSRHPVAANAFGAAVSFVQGQALQTITDSS